MNGMSVVKSRPHFAAVPYGLVDDETISPQAKAVYMVLDRHADYGSGATFVGKDRIARKCGYAKASSVDRYLAELRDKGWLSWRRRWRRTTDQVDAAGRPVHEYSYSPGDGYEPATNLYVVHDRPTVPAVGGTPVPAAGDTPIPSTGGTPVPAAGGTNKNQVNENQVDENQTPPNPQGGSAVTGAGGAQAQPSLLPETTTPAAPSLTDEFDAWWQQVPRKKAKADARKAFKAARKKATLQQLVDGLEASMRQWQAEGRDVSKIPYPATWLRAESWLDEHDQWQAPQQQQQRRMWPEELYLRDMQARTPTTDDHSRPWLNGPDTTPPWADTPTAEQPWLGTADEQKGINR